MKSILLILSLLIFVSVKGQKTVFNTVYGSVNGDFVSGVAQAKDSTIMIAGSTESHSTGLQDYYLLKLSRQGIYIDKRIFGTPGIDKITSIKTRPDSISYICTGFSNYSVNNDYNAVYFAININGDTLWHKTIGGNDWDQLNNGRVLPDSGYIFCGSTFSFGQGGSDVWLVRTDSLGNVLWTSTYGGLFNEEGLDVDFTPDSGFVVVGHTNEGAGKEDALLVKFDSNGIFQWDYQYGDTATDQFLTTDIFADGRILAAGFATNANQEEYFHVVLSPTGSITEFNITGGVYDERIVNGYEYKGSGLFIAGQTSSYGGGRIDYSWMMNEYSGSPSVTWPNNSNTFGFAGNEELKAAIVTLDGGFLFVGHTDTYPGLSNIYAVKADTLPYLEPTLVNYVSVNEYEISKEHLKVYPNPATDFVKAVTPEQAGVITITDITGKTVYSLPKEKYIKLKEIKLDGFMPGFYVITFMGTETGIIQTCRLILSR